MRIYPHKSYDHICYSYFACHKWTTILIITDLLGNEDDFSYKSKLTIGKTGTMHRNNKHVQITTSNFTRKPFKTNLKIYSSICTNPNHPFHMTSSFLFGIHKFLSVQQPFEAYFYKTFYIYLIYFLCIIIGFPISVPNMNKVEEKQYKDRGWKRSTQTC